MNKYRRKHLVAVSLFLALSVQAADESRWVEVKGGTWKVDAATVQDLKAGIVAFVETDNDPNSESSQKNIKGLQQRWKNYSVQYQGAKRNGTRVVFLNALCSQGERDLDKGFVRIYDGGDCYFVLNYDPQAKKFSDLWINGEG